MNELKPKDVVKALECCAVKDCIHCPNRTTRCKDALREYALALLREKDAEIKGLVDGWSKDQDRFEKVCAEKDAEIERLIKERDEARRDVGVAERNHHESEKEVERLKHILESYALQHGTARDKEYFLNKERHEAITEFVSRVLALNPFDKKFFVIGKGEIDRIAMDMNKMPKYQAYVSTLRDVRSLYERVKTNPSIKQYRGYTASKSYGYDAKTKKIIVKEGEFWFDNPSFRGTQ